ncbi:uncharacterized protein EAF01_008806 [Botrytis porri]|uniref:Uncharacterized protein n=1 Tax=Botrytis porri TaxID=87229 RepID=A0A4Z1KP14_9HELO|nr:uncharacterized protein EAF01_008806 [Botrytis porri]KAF7897840.1 hypothetical protein EAF01_008806 [Botrytis porri]TGO87126.1 hypothetical protein BPOR_0249g00160 [Botrytis porri]
MSSPIYLTPSDSDSDVAASLLSSPDYTAEDNAKEYPGFSMALQANGTTNLRTPSPVEELNQKKRKREDLEWSHRKAQIPTNGYGLTKEEMKTYTESSDKFENILAAHAASGVIPHAVDFRISLADHTRCLSVRDSNSGKLPKGESILTSLEFIERWIRLTPPVFCNAQSPTVQKWNEEMKEQDFAMRESSKWGPLYRMYEDWIVDQTNFYEPRHDSLDSLDFDFG